MRVLPTIAAAALVLSGAAQAAPVVLDFEGFASGQIIDTEYRDLGVTVSVVSDGANDLAIIFDSNDPNPSEDNDLVGPFDDESTPELDNFLPGNILIVSDDTDDIVCDVDFCTPPDDEALGGIFTFEFTSAVDILGIDVFDINSLTEDDELPITLRFFDSFGVMFNEIMLNTTGGENTFSTYVFEDIVGVFRLDVELYDSGAIDNIVFQASEMPLPGAIVFMIAGAAAGGMTLRKKKKS